MAEPRERQARMDERLRAQRGRRARPEVVADVERLTGSRPGLDDFLSAEATDRLTRQYLRAASDANGQRRTWSTDLRAEMADAVDATAARLRGVEAYWLHRLSRDAGAVRVDVGAMLAQTSFAAGDYDVVLVGDQARSGLRLAWDHLPAGDEYELLVWGSFQR